MYTRYSSMAASSSFTREITLLDSTATPPDFFKESLNAFQARVTRQLPTLLKNQNILKDRLDKLIKEKISVYDDAVTQLVAKGYIGSNAPTDIPNQPVGEVVVEDQFYNEKNTSYFIKWTSQKYISSIRVTINRKTEYFSTTTVATTKNQDYDNQPYDENNKTFDVAVTFVNPIGPSIPLILKVPRAHKPPLIQSITRARESQLVYIKLKDFDKYKPYKFIAVYIVKKNITDISDKTYIESIEYDTFKTADDGGVGSASPKFAFLDPTIQGIFIVGVFSNVSDSSYNREDATQRSYTQPIPNKTSNPIFW
jgi:hypothetical protein